MLVKYFKGNILLLKKVVYNTYISNGDSTLNTITIHHYKKSPTHLLSSRLCFDSIFREETKPKHSLFSVRVFSLQWLCSQISSTLTSQTALRKSSLSTYGETLFWPFFFFFFASFTLFILLLLFFSTRICTCLYVCVNGFVYFGELGSGFTLFLWYNTCSFEISVLCFFFFYKKKFSVCFGLYGYWGNGGRGKKIWSLVISACHRWIVISWFFFWSVFVRSLCFHFKALLKFSILCFFFLFSDKLLVCKI